MKRKLKTGLVLAFIAALLVLFARPDYRQGEPSLRGSTPKGFSAHARRQTRASFRLARQSRPAELLGLVVPAVRRRSAFAESAPATHRAARRHCPGSQCRRGRRGIGVRNFSEDVQRSDFPTYRDATKQLAASYGTIAYPETYVIDRKGRLDRKIVGPQDWTSPEMMTYLDSLLNER